MSKDLRDNTSGCQECRRRHLRCDKVTPVCGRCFPLGVECLWGRPYRNYRHKYSDDQPWVKVPQIIDAMWITEQCTGNTGSDDSASEDEGKSHYTPRSEESRNMFSPITPTGGIVCPPDYSYSPLSTLQSPLVGAFGAPQGPVARAPMQSPLVGAFGTPQGPVTRIPMQSPLVGAFGAPRGPVAPIPNVSYVVRNVFLPPESPAREMSKGQPLLQNDFGLILPPESPAREISKVPVSVYSNDVVWPLRDPEEAYLFEHYVQELARWLDLCDPNHHFQIEVPRRAPNCPLLLNAIFALSARHLNLTRKYDTGASNRYHAQCIKLMIPMLGLVQTNSDETLFASMIVLRVLEEIELLVGEPQTLSHLSGIQSFIKLHGVSIMKGGLSEAAFWVGLRQEIYVATIAERPITIDMNACLVDRSYEPTTDFGWANRAVVHLADVLNCCFDDSGVCAVTWTKLREYSERWAELKPSSFTPYFYKEADRQKPEPDVFPDIRHTHPCHIIGIQHHKLAQILLLTHDPRLPRIGGSRSTAELTVKFETMKILRELCGIGLSNRGVAPGLFTACMGINMCGDLFDDTLEQDAIIRVLVETEKVHARPTKAIQEQMHKAWGRLGKW
ncbi:hypothetical protein LZ554_003383 [Drepanopeziza brunnea f. sp. 'monogermtubi']|nr:hypothetical protein LZ554_003383 [Drepanopeziza brunnea f. sp. 'monogermtubi']